MDELLRRLHEGLAKARMEVVVTTPPQGADLGYHFGVRQGKCQGLERAIKIIEGLMNDIDEEEMNR